MAGTDLSARPRPAEDRIGSLTTTAIEAKDVPSPAPTGPVSMNRGHENPCRLSKRFLLSYMWKHFPDDGERLCLDGW